MLLKESLLLRDEGRPGAAATALVSSARLETAVPESSGILILSALTREYFRRRPKKLLPWRRPESPPLP